MSDINQQLIEAFQIEGAEHLATIRASLATWPSDRVPPNIDDVFRRAHSLKGAARIVGMTPVQELAHRLEDLFAGIRDGTIAPAAEVQTLIHAALDLIEDTIGDLLLGQAAPDAAEMLRQLDTIVHGEQRGTTNARADDPHQRLLREAFQEEYPSHLEAMRHATEQALTDAGGARFDRDLIIRCANSLAGAAHLVGATTVETIAHELELSIVNFGDDVPVDPTLVQQINRQLTAIEAEAAHFRVDGLASPAPAALAAAAAVEPVAHETSPAPPAADKPLATSNIETLRLSAESLDRLLESAGQLLTENLHQDFLGQELHGITQQLASVERQWLALLRADGRHSRRHLLRDEEDRSIMLQHEIRALARRLRAMRIHQQQSTWSVKSLATQLHRDIQQARMVTAESEFGGFRKMMRELARDQQKQVEFLASGLEVRADRMVLQTLKDPLMHILRNAIYHGIESPDERRTRSKRPAGAVSLALRISGNQLMITVADDGRGVDLDQIARQAVRQGLISSNEPQLQRPAELLRVLLLPGFSTSRSVDDLAGRGMGLSAVAEAVSRLQGSLEIVPAEHAGLSLVITVPLSIATHQLLLFRDGDTTLALPAFGVTGLLRLKPDDLIHVEGKPMVATGGQLIHLAMLRELLASGPATSLDQDGAWSAVLVRIGAQRLAIVVDAIVAERKALIKPLGPPVDRSPLYLGAIVLEDGAVAPILNPAELVKRFKPTNLPVVETPQPAPPQRDVPTILVVDDSFTTRTLETGILETNGYRVRVAVDGIEALSQLRAHPIDLVISDIQMPRLDGFGLLEQMKQDAHLAKIPVIIVSSVDRTEEQRRGLDLGADAYIVKQRFDHQELLNTVRQII